MYFRAELGYKNNEQACIASGGSVASLKLEDHVDGVASLHVVRLDGVLVSEGLTTEDKTNHGHVNALSLLKSLLDA